MKETRRKLSRPHFGLHLTFDGYECDQKILNSRSASKRFLNLLVEELRMEKLLGPHVVFAKGNDKKDPGGYSGFVIIQESHFSVHTFPKRKFVSIDVYSCRDFNYKRAIAFIRNFYKARSAETYLVVRGRKYPQKNLL